MILLEQTSNKFNKEDSMDVSNQNEIEDTD